VRILWLEVQAPAMAKSIRSRELLEKSDRRTNLITGAKVIAHLKQADMPVDRKLSFGLWEWEKI
jgi:hypothetical protein